MHINVLILALTLIFANTAPPVITMLMGIIGTDLAPNPSLATLPSALMMVGLGLSAIPAALLMDKVGRKAGFMGAFLLATIAIFVIAYGIWLKSFIVICIALMFVGGNLAFVGQFRFAAAESVKKENAGKAISYILLGGVVAAYFGPEIGKRSRDLIETAPYVGSFLSLGVLHIIGLIILAFYRNVETIPSDLIQNKRRIAELLKQPGVILAITSGTVSYAVMVTIMVATPIQMHVKDGYTMPYVAGVIQGHLLGMYVPSFFTGYLINRLGILKIMTAGAICFIASILFNISSHEIEFFVVGLILLGIGWNFLFISGTTLLTKHYNHSERFKAQAANEFIVYTTMATGSLSAGALLHFLGWEKLNLMMISLVVFLFIVMLFYQLQQRKPVSTQ